LPNNQEEKIWKEKANAEYQKVIGIFTALSSGALVLPTLFLRDYVAVEQGKSLLPYLSFPVYLAWALFSVSILAGAVYHYFSAKWLKKTFGGNVCASKACLELGLDIAFWVCVLCFIIGALSFVLYLATYTPKS
jgi:hypothetical protein